MDAVEAEGAGGEALEAVGLEVEGAGGSDLGEVGGKPGVGGVGMENEGGQDGAGLAGSGAAGIAEGERMPGGLVAEDGAGVSGLAQFAFERKREIGAGLGFEWF